MSGKINTYKEGPPEITLPEEVPKLIDMVPAKPDKILVREELDDVLRGHRKNRVRLKDFEVSPKVIGIKDIAKKHTISIRDVISGKLIKVKDIK